MHELRQIIEQAGQDRAKPSPDPGIGGVLDPRQAKPTIIGRNRFGGPRAEVVEGVIVEDKA